jgi:phage terminase small subunit
MASTEREWDAATQPPEGYVPERRKPGRQAKVQPGVRPGAMPLDYMLAVIRDPAAGVSRRDRMAIAAAPYCHARIAYATKGKKDQQAEAAATAGGTGTDWGADLEVDSRAN